MLLKKKLLAAHVVFFSITILNYILFFDKGTSKDEVILALLGGCFLFYSLVLRKLFASLSRLKEKTAILKISHEKGAEYKMDNIEDISSIMSQLSEDITRATNFINSIKSGDINEELIAEVQEKSHNPLNNALLSLRTQMLTLADEEKERNWINTGMAKFVDILRSNTENIDEFYDSLISNLVKYLGVNQGGLFLATEKEGEKILKLTSFYAFERKKYLEKEIEIGSGLVGQVYLEKETLYLREIPKNYISITSGLGGATPTSLLIVPFKLNDSVECVVEMASFHPFEEYQIKFLERVGESIASTVSNLKINENTKLLLEEAREQAELRMSQEEELRQNMEELEATQEEMRRKEVEMTNLLAAVEEREKELKEKLEEIRSMQDLEEEKSAQMIKTVEDHRKMLLDIIDKVPQKIFLKDAEGKFILANSAVAKAHNKTVEELLGTSDFDFFSFEAATSYRKAELDIIASGKPFYFPEEVFKDPNGNDRILQTTKIPFYIGYLDQMGLLGIQTDITEIKLMEKALQEGSKKAS